VSTPRKRTIIIIMSEFDQQVNPAGSALRGVESELNHQTDESGATATVSSANEVSPGTPDQDSHRDHETEQRVIERTEVPLRAMYERMLERTREAKQVLSTTASVAVEAVIEVKRLVKDSGTDMSIDGYLSVAAATSAARELWYKSWPTSEEVAKDCIKHAIKGVVFYGLWKMVS
jgi:hypothetical protein